MGEKFKDDDNKQKERISAKNGLESYCFDMKTTIDDEKMADKISADDKKLIADKCDEAIKWLDANQLAEVEEFQEKQKEVEGVCNPIITKLYDSAGARECLTWAVCPVACLVQEAPPLEVDPELDPPSRRSTKCIPSTSISIVLSINNPLMKP